MLSNYHSLIRRIVVSSILNCLVFQAGCSSKKVEKSDKALIVRATDLVKYGYHFKQIAKYEKFNKTLHFDGSVDLEYEFETPDSEQENPLYMLVMLSSQPTRTDALLMQGAEGLGLGLGLKGENIKQKLIKGSKKYGDNSSLKILLYEGDPVGNYFMCRKDERTYSILVTGFYIDSPEIWDKLVRTKVMKWLNASSVRSDRSRK